MGKFFKYLGIFFLSLIILIALFGTYSSFTGVDKEKTFLPFIKENIPKLTTWDYQVYKNLMVAPQNQTEKESKLYLKWFEKLGTFTSMGTPKFLTSKTNFGSQGRYEYVSYHVPLVFDTGNASVSLVLEYHKEEIKIYRLNFNSDILIQ
jgi:hypothetical protein